MSADVRSQLLADDIEYRLASISDLEALLAIEKRCFKTDLLSKRQFIYWLKAPHKVLQVALLNNKVIAYGLVIFRKGTSLARLYSLAVLPECRGLGLAYNITVRLEQACIDNKRAYLRLEVSEKNESAIKLYQSMGYIEFGFYDHYYEDDSKALRMQKPILQKASCLHLPAYPYYAQSTEFTCGPSALLMAMAKLDDKVILSQRAELELWRSATTIFMTSGHGGTHPHGLAAAAANRGFKVDVFVNQAVPLFLAGIRNEEKKKIVALVENDLVEKAQLAGVQTHYRDYRSQDIADALKTGASVLCLISSYQFDGYKGPHWVVVTHIDDDYLYIHDPDAEIDDDNAEKGTIKHGLYKQHIPVSLMRFESFTRFGKAKLRTAIILQKNK